jgi:hypothetical protein
VNASVSAADWTHLKRTTRRRPPAVVRPGTARTLVRTAAKRPQIQRSKPAELPIRRAPSHAVRSRRRPRARRSDPPPLGVTADLEQAAPQDAGTRRRARRRLVLAPYRRIAAHCSCETTFPAAVVHSSPRDGHLDYLVQPLGRACVSEQVAGTIASTRDRPNPGRRGRATHHRQGVQPHRRLGPHAAPSRGRGGATRPHVPAAMVSRPCAIAGEDVRRRSQRWR